MRVFIGILYIMQAVVVISLTELSTGLSCFGSCNDLTPVFKTALVPEYGVLAFILVETVGLWQRRSWARSFGIVLGILFPTSQFLITGVLKEPNLILKMPVLIIPILLDLAAVWYLLKPPSGFEWCPKDKYSNVLAFAFSFGVISMVAFNTVSYLNLELPVVEGQEAYENVNLRGTLSAGTPYKNEEYGFELTFPDKMKIYQGQSWGNSDEITFSDGGQFMGDLIISVTVIRRETVDNYAKTVADTRQTIKNVTINGISFTKIDVPFGSSIYLTEHDNKVFRFDSRPATPEQFNQVLQTLKFIDAVKQ